MALILESTSSCTKIVALCVLDDPINGGSFTVQVWPVLNPIEEIFGLKQFLRKADARSLLTQLVQRPTIQLKLNFCR
jgi:hypothetical protein